jgi:hypothetical protein
MDHHLEQTQCQPQTTAKYIVVLFLAQTVFVHGLQTDTFTHASARKVKFHNDFSNTIQQQYNSIVWGPPPENT